MNKQVSRPTKLAIIGGSAVYLLLIVDGCDTQRLSPYASGSLWIQDANHLVVRYPENLARTHRLFIGVRSLPVGHRQPSRRIFGGILAGQRRTAGGSGAPSAVGHACRLGHGGAGVSGGGSADRQFAAKDVAAERRQSDRRGGGVSAVHAAVAIGAHAAAWRRQHVPVRYLRGCRRSDRRGGRGGLAVAVRQALFDLAGAVVLVRIHQLRHADAVHSGVSCRLAASPARDLRHADAAQPMAACGGNWRCWRCWRWQRSAAC